MQTAATSQEDMTDGIKYVAYCYITKPIEQDELTLIIKKIQDEQKEFRI